MDRAALDDRQRHQVCRVIHESNAVQIHLHHSNRRCLYVPLVPGSVKKLHNNNFAIENEVTYVSHKYSSALNNYTIQAANKKRRWSDCADAQTDLRLCCSHMQLADFLKTWIIIIIFHHIDKTIQFYEHLKTFPNHKYTLRCKNNKLF